MVYLRTLERERELKEEGREEGVRVTESRYKPILKQKDDLIEQQNTEITRLKALLAAHDIKEA